MAFLVTFVLVFLAIFNSYPVNGNDIVFQKYCLNGSDPETLPIHGEHSSGSLVMSSNPEGSPWYSPNMNCSVTFSTESNYHILLTFSKVSLRNSSMDNLTVVFNSGVSDQVLFGQQVCSNENCEGLKFESGNFNNMTLKFISANVTVPLNVTGFIAHYTVFDLANKRTGACKGRERFLCENQHCIWYSLTCDGHNDCGDLSDETKCIIPTKNVVWGIVVIFIAIVAVLVFVPVFCYLATAGTRNIVKIVTVPNQATPLLSAADAGEATGLLTSSEAFSQCWPGSSYDSNYGAAPAAGPSKSLDSVTKTARSTSSDGDKQNRFL
ncbi:uncharacterized protein [Parasteatoda tepidariorum]|nr:uncharacterized protein LOC107436302 isoform X2 [Parasteatoda tepidariorum]XP_015903440.1 uncharacterized protein LOC107436302 isoform X2 [Parasteatoda tepidariorum]XP_042894928.1 uncharacterized protein LOC107436302 isoform X2 [Parasteatoda tepidariorum]